MRDEGINLRQTFSSLILHPSSFAMESVDLLIGQVYGMGNSRLNLALCLLVLGARQSHDHDKDCS